MVHVNPLLTQKPHAFLPRARPMHGAPQAEIHPYYYTRFSRNTQVNDSAMRVSEKRVFLHRAIGKQKPPFPAKRRLQRAKAKAI